MKSAAQGSIRGIVLGGVHAWGESVLERICPRPLLPVAGRPLVWYGLDWLRKEGVNDITICANSDTHALRSCLGDGNSLGMDLDYYEDTMPRGPAGCIRDAALHGDAETLVVVEGAVLPQLKLDCVLKAHKQSGSVLTIVAFEQNSASGLRVMEPAGIYVVSRSALNLVPPRGYQDIKEMWIPQLYCKGCRSVPYLVGPDAALRVRGVGSYLRATVQVLETLSTQEGWQDEYRRIGGAWVHRSAQVSTSARLAASTLVGPHARIEKNAVLMGPTIIGPDSRVGAAAILNGVVTWARCEIGAGAILNHCILLADSSVESGLVVRETIYCRESAEGVLRSCAAEDYWALYPLSSVV